MATVKIGCLNKQSVLAIALSTISVALTVTGVAQRFRGPRTCICACLSVPAQGAVFLALTCTARYTPNSSLGLAIAVFPSPNCLSTQDLFPPPGPWTRPLIFRSGSSSQLTGTLLLISGLLQEIHLVMRKLGRSANLARCLI